MRKNYLILILLLITWQSFSQIKHNLVPNWSFEDSAICPAFAPNYNPLPKPWYHPNKKVNYCLGYYFNRCSQVSQYSVPYNYDNPNFSYQETKSGDAYAVVATYYNGELNGRKYIQTKMISPLVAAKKYYCKFWISKVDVAAYASNNISLLLTNNPIYIDTITNHCDGLLVANPQITNYSNQIVYDSINWVPIQGVYKATGGEQFITIGNFKPDNQTLSQLTNTASYARIAGGYYVDDISVQPLDSICLKADAGLDKNIALGDSIFIGSNTNGLDTILWLQNGITKIDSIRPGFFVKPTISTFYILQQTVNGCFTKDTVYVNVNPMPLKFASFNAILRNEKFIEINWETSNEVNVKSFYIQRSMDGINFITIANEIAKNSSLNQYNFFDKEPLIAQQQEKIYYRIIAIDYDGKKTYSSTKQITVKSLNEKNVLVFPNPAKSKVFISSIEPLEEIIFFNQLGQIVKQLSNPSLLQTINIEQFANGFYHIQVISKYGRTYSYKLVKE